MKKEELDFDMHALVFLNFEKLVLINTVVSVEVLVKCVWESEMNFYFVSILVK